LSGQDYAKNGRDRRDAEIKLVRFGGPGAERPDVIDNAGRIRDLFAIVSDTAGVALSPASLERMRHISCENLLLVEEGIRLGACVGLVGKFICIGLNYSDHAAEFGIAVPMEPVAFMKANSCKCGPNDDVEIPKGSEKTDWEVELGVVIGAKAKYVSKEDALSCVARYCVVNDLSERAFQLEGTGQWVKSKSADTFGPIGPWLVTTDDVPDPQNLLLWLKVDGRRYQDGSTLTMVFGVSCLVSYLSQFMTLYPGDIISTETPPGVGLGQKSPIYLSGGNVIRLGIDGLGEHRQHVVAGGIRK
jgi:2-keto-4-pentenoate hydratase/2-oxohepta-3-ene-1,7-dioic acid hydratase in catechol pathway